MRQQASVAARLLQPATTPSSATAEDLEDGSTPSSLSTWPRLLTEGRPSLDDDDDDADDDDEEEESSGGRRLILAAKY